MRHLELERAVQAQKGSVLYPLVPQFNMGIQRDRARHIIARLDWKAEAIMVAYVYCGQ